MKRIYNLFTLVIASLLMFTACDDDEEMALAKDASILSCTVSSNGMSFDAGITGSDILVNLPLNSDLSDIKVDFELSAGSEVSPSPELVADWSVPVNFSVVSADKANTKTYTVTVKKDTDKVFDSAVHIGNNTALQKFAENGYTELGGLFIFDDNSGDEIYNLDALNKVSVIRTDLELHSDYITSVRLESLKNIGNVDIISLSVEEIAFPSLEYVSGRFRVGNDDPGFLPDPNVCLKSISMDKLKSVGKSLITFLNSNLEEINTASLNYIGEDLKLFGGKFSNLNMIKNLTEVRGIVQFNSSKLTSLEGFNLKTIGGALYLTVEGLESLEPLKVLEKVPYINLFGGEECYIESFKGLENIDLVAMDINGLPWVKSTKYLPLKNGMEHISLQNLTGLVSLEGFENITEIGNLFFIGLVEIEDMHQICNLKKVDNLTFDYMEKLVDLPNLSNLTSLSGKLIVSKMRKLSNLKGLSAIKEVGALQVDNLLGAISLTGLENLEKVTNGGILIGNCPMVTSLYALKNLKEVNMPLQTDRFVIKHNEALVDYTAVRDVLIKYWNAPGGKMPKVEISENKYNPSYQDLVDGKCIPE